MVFFVHISDSDWENMPQHDDNVHAAEQQAEDLENAIIEINSDVERLKENKTINPRKDILRIEEKIDDAKNLLAALRNFSAGLTKERARFREIISNHKSDIQNAEEELEWYASKNEIEMQETKVETLKNADEAINYGDNLMDDTDASMKRTKKMLGETFKEANQAAETLAEQRQQFEKMIEKTYEVEDEMKRARKITGILLRRVMQDRVMWCFLFLIIVAVVAVVVKEIGKGKPPAGSSCSAITMIGTLLVGLIFW